MIRRAEEVRQLLDAGLCQAAIAHRMGISRQRVHQVVRALNTACPACGQAKAFCVCHARLLEEHRRVREERAEDERRRKREQSEAEDRKSRDRVNQLRAALERWAEDSDAAAPDTEDRDEEGPENEEITDLTRRVLQEQDCDWKPLLPELMFLDLQERTLREINKGRDPRVASLESVRMVIRRLTGRKRLRLLEMLEVRLRQNP